MALKQRLERLERALKPEPTGPELVAYLTRLYADAGLEEGEEAALEMVRRCRERGLDPSLMSLAKLMHEADQ